MSDVSLKIARIRCDAQDAAAELAQVRAKLSPQGDVVSEAGRRKTLEVFGEALSPRQVVQRICRDVQAKGREAVLDYANRIDRGGLTPESMRVAVPDMEAAHAAAAPEFLASVRRIRDNIVRFQSAILHKDVRVELPAGGYLAQRYRPLERVGVCVPGGAAAYPSTVLMTVVPAQTAGVKQVAVVAPPTRYGSNNPDLLATCYELGVREVYRLGGAQGVAAMAYGIEGLPAVQKIVGPGNLFVALAKQQVYGQVDIDSIAGPSEVVVVADDGADPAYIAADLIAQAEHSPGSAVLVTWSERVWRDTATELEKQLATADRGDLTRVGLEEFSALVLARDSSEATRIAASFAPEHLHIQAADPEALLQDIPTAGAAFLGPFSPVAVGDYAAGPSHVLPTSGTATWAHGLSANDFLRPHSVISYTSQNLLDVAPDVLMLAGKEGLSAHAESISIRLDAARRDAGQKGS
ncbi:MAG TPA: histidinol dehydrogenase [Pirellulales bacterium]